MTIMMEYDIIWVSNKENTENDYVLWHDKTTK